jgi:large subunit ribosomal protein L5
MSFEQLYKTKIVKQLVKDFDYDNIMLVPKITKITINMGVGEAAADSKVLDFAKADMQKIAGQKPMATLARKSIANFKIREDWPLGCKVTLRRQRMYDYSRF